MSLTLSLSLSLSLSMTLGPSRAAPLAQEPEVASDEAARAAWDELEPGERTDLVEWFRAEVVHLPTFQNRLIEYVLGEAPRDPGLWPAQEPAPWFDPAVHAPAQPIRRKPLPAGSRELEKRREAFFFRVPNRRLESAWRYDYASRELRRVEVVDDERRVFENGLRGFPPDLDLAEALVELALDRGEERESLAAFGHAYTDRDGDVYPGLTLYDAWASGSNMEMPDVDVLGIIHTLDEDWKTYVAPVPSSKHRALYDRVGELFGAAHSYRGLRCALARTYLTGEPVLRDGYGHNSVRFHALWDLNSSTPARLAPLLPDAAGWQDYLEGWIEEVDGDPELLAKGEARRDTLIRDGSWVRKRLLELMVEGGYLEAGD